MDAVIVRSEVANIPSQTELVSRDRKQEANDIQRQPVLRLRLQKPKSDKKVAWQHGTVDNEHLNKKKSKCCCIYRKPLSFGESSSEDDEDCENCFGHPEKRLKNQQRRKRNDTAANSNEQVDDKYDVSNHEDVSAVNVMHQ